MSQLDGLPCKVCRHVNCHCRPKKQPVKSIRRLSKKKQDENKGLKSLHETDAKIYLEVWQERQHICENCTAPIHKPTLLNFHHLAEKRNYPTLRHLKINIALLCADCHSQVETNPAKTPKLNERRAQIIALYYTEISEEAGQCLGE